jgi:hypothetical protein
MKERKNVHLPGISTHSHTDTLQTHIYTLFVLKFFAMEGTYGSYNWQQPGTKVIMHRSAITPPNYYLTKYP